MIDSNQPDYTNTPASEQRPPFTYAPRDYSTPTVSIITPYYNTGPVFLETVHSIQRMSFAHWEWLIVDDGSTEGESLAQLEQLQAVEPRVRVIHQANSGPGVARNRAAKEARGRYLLQVDSDDLMEPTFVEKAIWFLETQPQFAACGSYNVCFGSKNFLWPNGFHNYEKIVEENRLVQQAVIRRDAYFQAGGYDESCTYSYEDWDFWLNLAEAGLWGFTIPEYLTWYRHQEDSRMAKARKDPLHDQTFLAWLQQKHRGLANRFPHPRWEASIDIPHARISDEIPVKNALLKPEGTKRVLFIVPWLEMGGVEKFNLDLMKLLSRRGYEFTVVTTLEANDSWKSLFTSITPDVFCLHLFLNRGDYPRFLNYLIDSRHIDAVLMADSAFAYLISPYLRAHHPNLPILDFNHLEDEDWKDGGHPALSVRLGRQLDLNITCTDHLKHWMVARGADPDRIEVVHYGIDTAQWNPQQYDPLALRQRLGIAPDLPLILFVGRIVDVKRPLFFARIIKQLADHHPSFLALVVGTGPDLPAMKAYVTDHKLEQHIRFMGALPNPRVRELMAASDILLLPSDREGLALVLYECMAMETVPVAAAVGGQAELVTPECGYLVAKGDQEVEEYVEVLLHLLRDPQRRRSMGKQGRQRVGEYFNRERIVDGIEHAFQRARQFAEARPAEKSDMELARYIAYLAVEYTRIEHVADTLWGQREKYSAQAAVQSRQPLKRRLLPFGSRRHETYKRIRRGVSRVVHVATNPRRVAKKSVISEKTIDNQPKSKKDPLPQLPSQAPGVKQSKLPPKDSNAVYDALVLDAWLRQSLVAVRSLGCRGLRVAALSSMDAEAAFASRWCQQGFYAPSYEQSPEPYLAYLEQLLDSVKAGVLITSADDVVEIIRPNRERLEKRIRIALAKESALKVACNKEKTLELAQQLGIRIPRAVKVKVVSEVEAAVGEIGLPAVVKPVIPWAWGGPEQRGQRLQCELVTTLEEAQLAVLVLTSFGVSTLFQEYIPGRREQMMFVYANGQVHARFAQWTKRTLPPLGGTSVLRQSIAVPADSGDQAERLIRELELEGYSAVEFRRDNDGVPYLMEINPRLSASVEIAVRSGVDFPYLLYQWANQERINVVKSYRVGGWMRWLGGDIIATRESIQQRNRPGVTPPARAVVNFCLSFFMPSGYDYMHWRDPLPAFIAAKSFIGRWVGKPLMKRLARLSRHS